MYKPKEIDIIMDTGRATWKPITRTGKDGNNIFIVIVYDDPKRQDGMPSGGNGVILHETQSFSEAKALEDACDWLIKNRGAKTEYKTENQLKDARLAETEARAAKAEAELSGINARLEAIEKGSKPVEEPAETAKKKSKPAQPAHAGE